MLTKLHQQLEEQSWPAEKKFPQRESRLVLRDIDFTVTCHILSLVQKTVIDGQIAEN